MKFSEEQIKKVTAIRDEFMKNIMMFEHGIYYAKRMFAPNEEFDSTWIEEVKNKIYNLELEEMLILDDINIANLGENEFYVCLGQYFKRISSSWKWDKNNATLWFNSVLCQYKKDIVAALKS